VLDAVVVVARVLTVVTVASEQHVVPDEVGTPAELGPVGDEHLFDGRIVVDHDARHGAHGYGVDRPVPVGQLGEPPERMVPMPVHDVQRPDDRVRGRSDERWRRIGRG